jgi:Flp pilus assembly CpaF family ATPase
MLPDGSRLHVVIPDIVRRHWSVNIRKFVLSANSMDELVALGTLTAQAARFLEAVMAAGLNVIVAGGTQAGKTTSRQDAPRPRYVPDAPGSPASTRDFTWLRRSIRYL